MRVTIRGSAEEIRELLTGLPFGETQPTLQVESPPPSRRMDFPDLEKAAARLREAESQVAELTEASFMEYLRGLALGGPITLGQILNKKRTFAWLWSDEEILGYLERALETDKVFDRGGWYELAPEAVES